MVIGEVIDALDLVSNLFGRKEILTVNENQLLIRVVAMLIMLI